MIVLRGLAFLFFVLLAAAMMLWQGNHLVGDLATAWSSTGALALMGLGLVVLAGQAVGYRALGSILRFLKRAPLWLLLVGGLLISPVVVALLLVSLPVIVLLGIVGGLVSLLQLQTGNHTRIWLTALAMWALVTLNVIVPLTVGTIA